MGLIVTEKRKGGRMKTTWFASIRSVGQGLAYLWTEDGRTTTGAPYQVHVRVKLDRDPDRKVSVRLSVKDARDMALALQLYADKAEKENRNAGYQ